MTRELDLADIQGNIVRAYAGYNYPIARYFCLHIDVPSAGRAFVDKVRREVTTAERWEKGSRHYKGRDAVTRPDVTVNIALSFRGLLNLELPTRTLRRMPAAFIDGMARRAHLLGDTGKSGLDTWDRVWRQSFESREASKRDARDANEVHILVSLNAQADDKGEPLPALEEKTDWLRGLCDPSGGGVRLLSGHGPDDLDYQPAKASMVEADGRMVASPREHFGYVDGIGNPVFEGQYPPEVEAERVIGRGKLMPDQTWKPLAPGEFILGLPDESQQLPDTAPPAEFMRNGTFMVWRKLHQNVKAFRDYTAETARTYANVMDVPVEQAEQIVPAKMVGRWKDGVPLMAAPDYRSWQAFRDKWGKPDTPEKKRAYERALIDFKYRDDPEGLACPVAAHIRRGNTRDMLDPTLRSKNPKDLNGSALNKRRRILRRGLPYGSYGPHSDNDDGEHGVIFVVVCADIFRQFEFVQQQWIQYGLDFNVGNDTCPIVGNRDADAKFVIAADPEGGKPPFVCPRLPQFVATRGGEYFFMPSMTALRMIAMGTVDPT